MLVVDGQDRKEDVHLRSSSVVQLHDDAESLQAVGSTCVMQHLFMAADLSVQRGFSLALSATRA